MKTRIWIELGLLIAIIVGNIVYRAMGNRSLPCRMKYLFFA